MELLCVLAAVAALFCGCTVLTLKCRVPASVAPLTALSLIVAVLTLAAMADSCEIGSRLAASVICTAENVCPRFRPQEFGLDVEVVD